jgi:uncharacterized protein
VQWVIKATKLCNLRCKYCYEWDSLADPTRMSLHVWERTLGAIVEYAGLAEEQSGVPVFSDVIWHGGEPLLLPAEYFLGVLELQGRVIPDGWAREGRIRNCIQTNLFTVSDSHLDILQRHDFQVGVSLDFVSGVRVTAGGRVTEERVRRNLARLDVRGIPYQLITVLANHTASDVRRVFDEIRAVNVPTRLLPLFAGPAARDMLNVELPRPRMLDAMLAMFELWFDAGMSPKIRPFDEAVETIVMKRLGLARPRHDRANLANEVLVVDRDGSLSSAAQRDSWCIGNLVETSIGEIVRSDEYRALVADETELKRAICGECPFLGPCDTSPITSCFDSFILRDCVIEKPLFAAIESRLEARGLLDGEFMRSAQALVADYAHNVLGLEPVSGPHERALAGAGDDGS